MSVQLVWGQIKCHFRRKNTPPRKLNKKRSTREIFVSVKMQKKYPCRCDTTHKRWALVNCFSGLFQSNKRRSRPKKRLPVLCALRATDVFLNNSKKSPKRKHNGIAQQTIQKCVSSVRCEEKAASDLEGPDKGEWSDSCFSSFVISFYLSCSPFFVFTLLFHFIGQQISSISPPFC